MTTELNANELIALEKLKQVSHESLWILAINKVLTDFSVEAFRKLISSLLSQNDDNPEVMQRILGPAYESVVNLKSPNNQHTDGTGNQIQGGQSGNNRVSLVTQSLSPALQEE